MLGPQARTWAEKRYISDVFTPPVQVLVEGKHLLGLRPILFGPCMGPWGPTWGTRLWLVRILPLGQLFFRSLFSPIFFDPERAD